MLGPNREPGPAGWAVLLLGQAAFAALILLVVEHRRRAALTSSLAFAVGAWFICGAVLMPLIGFVQGPAPAGTAAAMQATFFMLNLGPGAAAEALVGWLLFGTVIAAGSKLQVTRRAFMLAVGAAAVAALIAFAAPVLGAQAGSGRVVEGRIDVPPTPVFISVLELPQPAGDALVPHPPHIAGFVVDAWGTATMVVAGTKVDVGPGETIFLPNQVLHDHENRAAVPFAIALVLVVAGLSVAFVLLQGRGPAVAVMAALLVAGTVATVNPLMNHWYFIGLRPATMRGGAMPVPAGHRTYESENLTGLASGPYVEHLTHRRLASGESVRVVGPAAIVVLDGQASITASGRTTGLSAASGMTIAGGTEATVQPGSASARVLLVELLPAS